jgi:large subunit ribosomal protein L20
MPRIKRGTQARKRHKKVLKQAKGYYGARSRVYRVAKQAVIKAAQYSYRDRKQRKRQFRRIWILKINAISRKFDLSYNKLIYLLKINNIQINRKLLAHLAMNDENFFKSIINEIKS